MKKNTLSRYQRTADNKVIIEIAAEEIKHLYNNFDRHAPYIRKDLDPDLTDYLIDSVAEIGKEIFVIHFVLNTIEDESLIKRVKTSIQNYFLYLVDRENQNMRKLIKTSTIYFFIGIVILTLSYWYNNGTLPNETYLSHILTQGLNIAAWVSLWNAIATFLINWTPHRNLVNLYRRISAAEISFSTSG
jgi:hypothetical protein